jgi:serine/threonine protein kinase/Flp pilus assembly protein TadD
MIGETVLHYRIDGHLGRGGMGVVFRATDLKLLRTVALKFIPPDVTADPDANDRFLREARAASSLDHVNVGTIFGVEQAPDGRQFIVMAYYEGETLAREIARGPIDPDRATEIVSQVVAGLAAAHARGIVHRDIKPSNVIVTREGVVKIVDFGLASLGGSTRLTVSGTRMGTPHYMSPEQALGATVDHRSDLWSLGVMLHEMLTGRPTFDAGSIPAVLYRIVHDELSLEGLTDVHRAVISRTLRKDPAERFQSARQLALALNGIDSAEPVIPHESDVTVFTPPPTPPVRPGSRIPVTRSVSRYSWPHKLALAAVLLLPVLGWAAWAYWRPTSSSAAGAHVGSGTTTYGQGYHSALDLLNHWYKGDNLERATAVLDEAVQDNPSFALGHARLAEAYRLQAAVNRDPATLTKARVHAEKAAELGKDLPSVHTILGKVYSALNEDDRAVSALNRALMLDRRDGEAHVALGRLYEKLGRQDDARESFQRGVDLQPDAWQNLYAAGSFHFRHGRYKEAIDLWIRVTTLTPDNAAALTNLGAALLEIGRLDEAQDAYRQAIEISPNHTAYMNRGKVFFLQARFDEAAQMFEKAAAMNAEDYVPAGNLAAAYSWIPARNADAKQAFERAAEMAETRAKATPDDAFVFADLSLYYAKLGEGARARARLRTALALEPKNAAVEAAAGEVSEVLGDRDAAIRHLRKAIDLGYRREELQRNPELRELLSDARMSGVPSPATPTP